MTQHYKLVLKTGVPAVSQFRNIFYYAETTDAYVLEADWQTLADALWTTMKPIVSSQVTEHSWDLYKFNVDWWQLLFSGSLSGNGALTGDSLPYQNAAVVIGKTQTKRTFARKFIGPLGESQQAGGVLLSGVVTSLQTFADLWTDTYVTGSSLNLNPETWSKAKGFHELSSNSVNTVIGSQRRRKPGIGI